MLTLTLRGLERDGLTPLGRTLLEPVQALAAWAQANREKIQAARNRFDQIRA